MAGAGRNARRIARLFSPTSTTEAIAGAVRNLGGHDLGDLLGAFAEADRVTDRPSVVLAYTIKAWRLPTEGHPGNHSALLPVEQWRQLGLELGADPDMPWANFAARQPGGRRVRRRRRTPRAARAATKSHRKTTGRARRCPAGWPESTQQALGRFLLDLSRVAPEVAARVVTVSPDVASSTNLGGWINRVGIWHMDDRPDWFAQDRSMLVHWTQSQKGQHIELGIAEVNLVGLLSELGLTWSRDGEPLLPIGTLYDPFVAALPRALVVRYLFRRASPSWWERRRASPLPPKVAPTSRSSRLRSASSSRAARLGSRRLSRTLSGPCCTPWAASARPEGTSAYFRLSTRPDRPGACCGARRQ